MSDDADYDQPAPATLDDVVRELSGLGQVVRESHATFRRHAEDIELALKRVIKSVDARSEAEEHVKQHLLAIWRTIAILLVVVILATIKAGLLSWSW